MSQPPPDKPLQTLKDWMEEVFAQYKRIMGDLHVDTAKGEALNRLAYERGLDHVCVLHRATYDSGLTKYDYCTRCDARLPDPKRDD